MMSTENARKLIEMDMMGYEVCQTNEYISVGRPMTKNVSFFMATRDQNLQVEEAWKFVEKFEAYILSSPPCHHAKL